ncbi:MAG: prepilin-type N-terminal cleavage/methylation domain-containing protein [Azonexus sp.]|nr:prepilin-type N-terminal cleavage/methylation domain-containing protein [Azonexus sp.]
MLFRTISLSAACTKAWPVMGNSGRQEGFALMEALVAMLIFALGILGMVGLQASMTREQTAAKLRSDAAYLASEFVGNMWGDIPNLGQYSSANCNGYTRCRDWLNKVAATMPGGSATLIVTPGVGFADVSVTVIWVLPGGERHQYTTVTTVAAAG